MFTNGITIIAEVGSNHNGDLSTALKLIDTASATGADVCKFQSFLADDLLAANDPNYNRLKKLEMPLEWYPLLMAHCKEVGVQFLSTATNFDTLELMEEKGAFGYKVASCNITHIPLLERLIKIGKPLIISTGMASLQEIVSTRNYLQSQGHKDHAFLHCVSKYPTPPEEMALKNISVLREILNCPVGLSDHSHGTHIASAAVALGASIIEKHISLGKKGLGMDHEVAILPDEFSRFCRQIREIEKSLTVDFEPDADMVFNMRRSIHYARDLAAGSVLGVDDIKIVRPEDGLPPTEYKCILGSALKNAVEINAPVLEIDLDRNRQV